MPNKALERVFSLLFLLIVPATTLRLEAAEENIPCPEPAAEKASEKSDLRDLTLEQALMMALANNRDLAVERFAPVIRQTYEAEERAAFDPVVAVEASQARDWGASTNSPSQPVATDKTAVEMGLSQTLPTGTRIDLHAAGSRVKTEDSQRYASGVELTASQALLRGRPVAVNLARLRQARFDTEISKWELVGFAQEVVAMVEAAYWECVLAESRVRILRTSLDLAEQQAAEIAQRIRVGALPETEQAAARAESALRKEALINAEGVRATMKLRLLRLVAPALFSCASDRTMSLATSPVAPTPAQPAPVAEHLEEALRLRPDLNEARLRLDRNELEVARTRNGLLPKLDLFARLGDSGYAASFSEALRKIDGDEWEGAIGLKLEFPVINRAERARHKRALATREQATEALLNMIDLARLDVEIAHLEVIRTTAQVAATAETRRLQEEKVRAENAKFAVGKSTALAAAQAQRDFVDSQISEAAAVVRLLEAWLLLYRADGSLLERRGLVVTP